MEREIKYQFDKHNIENVSRETFLKLEKYAKLVIEWNNRLNLIGKNTVNEIIVRHIIDSAQIINYIDDKNTIITDIGSGAGFPGVILSLLGVKQVNLVEIDQKKSIFLKQIASIFDNICVYNQRIEDLDKDFKNNIITARALAKISDIFLMTKNIHFGKKLILSKGENYIDELLYAEKIFDFDYRIHQSITNDKSVIIVITNVKRK